MPKNAFLAVLTAIILATGAFADTPRPITLDPITHNDAELLIMRTDGTEMRFAPADLENLDTYRLRTTTPWREEPANFDGVLLSDLLELNDLAQLNEIKVIAENDFASAFPRALWETVPVLVATRVDGRALTRRERGPILFVIDSDDYATSPLTTEAHLVWMVARIEPE